MLVYAKERVSVLFPWDHFSNKRDLFEKHNMVDLVAIQKGFLK